MINQLKPLGECSEKEKRKHNIMEDENHNILMKIIKEEENLKPISEYLQE
ncbi:hypothetical protein IKI14_04100 [bacterium]|jgi:hypothetical protein|nr:hypothetical protein [bacterium]